MSPATILPVDEIAKTAAIKVTREIRTSRHCMFPMEGRGVVAYRDQRLRYLTLITSTQFPHSVQTGLCECLGLDDGAVRIISHFVAQLRADGLLECKCRPNLGAV